jgi:tetratricopeptide (TPR) repeat protein
MNYEEAKLWFSNLETSWLLIFDNADNTTIDYSEFFPSGRKGSLLFTTRNEQCSMYGTVGCYEFDKLGLADAVTLLLKSSGFEEKLWPERSEEARILVGDEILAQHALAITQAGAFIKQGLCKLEEYQSMFDSQRQRLLNYRPTQAKTIYGDVYATFEVSANAIKASLDPGCKDALKLLDVLAFLYREGVSEETFIRAWNYSLVVTKFFENDSIGQLSLWHVKNVRTVLHKKPTLQELDLLAFRQARQILRSFSLITVNPETNDISMHPLIHKWARDRLHPNLQIAAWATAASILVLSTDNFFNKDVDYDYLRKIQTHVEFCLSLQPQDIFAIGKYPPLDICRIFYLFAYVVYKVGNYELAEELGNELLSKTRREISSTSRNWRNLKYLASICQRSLGKYEEEMNSIKCVVLFDEENKVDPKSLDFLEARDELALAHLHLGEIREAINILEEVVSIKKKALPSANMSLLKSQHNLAYAYLDIRQHDKAIQLLEEVVRIREKSLAPTHPDLLASQHSLARAYLEIGQPEEALKLLQEVVRIREKSLTPTHPNLLASQHSLAGAYLSNGQLEEGLKLLQMVVRIHENSLAPTHPNLLASQHELARAYLSNGQLEEGLKLLQMVVRIQEKSLPLTHLHLLQSQYLLAYAYYGLGEYQTALSIIQKVVETEATILKAGNLFRVLLEDLLAKCTFAIEQETVTNIEANAEIEDLNDEFGASELSNDTNIEPRLSKRARYRR